MTKIISDLYVESSESHTVSAHDKKQPHEYGVVFCHFAGLKVGFESRKKKESPLSFF